MSSLSCDESLWSDECFVMFVLSHGTVKEVNGRKVDCVFGSDGLPVAIDDILSPFTNARCPFLKNKPKLMFFQACRGGTLYIYEIGISVIPLSLLQGRWCYNLKLTPLNAETLFWVHYATTKLTCKVIRISDALKKCKTWRK